VIPVADLIAKRKYCKWHNSYSHTTNECHYFQQQVQLVINDGRLVLGDGGKWARRVPIPGKHHSM
jgi:hypothetical protein